MKKPLLAATFAILAAGLALTGCKKEQKEAAAPEPQKMVLRYAENQAQDYPTTQAARKFAELVEQKTNGRIHIDVYHGGQLGDEKSVIEQPSSVQSILRVFHFHRLQNSKNH